MLGSKYTTSYNSGSIRKDDAGSEKHSISGGLSDESQLTASPRKHVLNDLQPYVCTHTKCNVPDHLFENRDTWYSHETQQHKVEFFCNTDGHQGYTQLTNFETHMKQEHDTTLDSSSALLDIFSGDLCNLLVASAICVFGKPNI